MARAFLRSFEAHSCSYVTKMIDKNAPSGHVRSSRDSAAQTPGPVYSPNRRHLTWSLIPQYSFSPGCILTKTPGTKKSTTYNLLDESLSVTKRSTAGAVLRFAISTYPVKEERLFAVIDRNTQLEISYPRCDPCSQTVSSSCILAAHLLFSEIGNHRLPVR